MLPILAIALAILFFGLLQSGLLEGSRGLRPRGGRGVQRRGERARRPRILDAPPEDRLRIFEKYLRDLPEEGEEEGK
jgi:hypothetical protein